MSKRLIGIEVGDGILRVAILNRQKGDISIGALVQRSYADQAELSTHLHELLAGEFRIGDQLATSLPARSAYVRQLQFPFFDARKISAAIPFELSAQLPVAIDDCALAQQRAQRTEDGAQLTAAAVPTATIDSLLGLFEAADVPLHLIDLAPFSYVAGLGELFDDGILICATEQETTVSLVQNGRLVDYRVMPPGTGRISPGQLQQLARELNVLKRAAKVDDLPVSLIGAGATAQVAEALQGLGHSVELLSLELGGQPVDAEYLPALALALRCRSSRQEHVFNFRQGKYALKGEWANLKGKLVLLAALTVMTLLILVGSMALKYLDKADRANQLQTEMVTVYRSLFPNAVTIVDVPLQLQSAIRDLQARSNLLTSDQAPALTVIREISRLSLENPVEIQEFILGPGELKLNGWTGSFDGVNQMTRLLEASPLFTRVQVADSKMSLDGSRVDFRLSLALAAGGTTP